eukprot:CAMPEP_0114656524 /NCGR_PEP_ID=MMETSP0191-20121206/12472_1 /TAXON_ID=126664 /ORGANISM="Sorites sp." /LENGTH=180 /DNA_ID=CAMNT_0001873909 /DNA_START=258 /DNA_END=797 /DNA_ORIENTATION=-
MKKIGMPTQSVINRMIQDGISKDIIEEFEETGVLPGGNALPSSNATPNDNITDPKARLGALLKGRGKPAIATKGATATKKITAEDEQKLTKYKKMKKLNMPKQSIINRMRQDQMPANLIGYLFPDAVEGKSATKRGAKKAKPKNELPKYLKPKKKLIPKVKMKNLHWTVINPFNVDKTIW